MRNASKPKKAAANGRRASSTGEADEAASQDVDDLLPRIDVSPQLGSKIIASLGSANWKERNHTMEDIENIVRGAARIQPNVGDLIPSLKVGHFVLLLPYSYGLLTICKSQQICIWGHLSW